MRRWTIAVTAAALAIPMAAVAAEPVVGGVPAAQAATVYPGGPDLRPVMGWSGWSFLRLADDEADVKGEARALVSSGLSSVGYRYINIDDGWYQCPGPQGPNVDKYGRWVVNAANYPSVGSKNGVQALAAYVHSLGLKFGIYETTGISMQAVARNTRILGTRYTADDIATKTPENNYNCGGMVGIDYAKRGAQAYVDSIVDELASWGVDYVKLDGITNSNGPDIRAWQAAIHHSGRPMVLDTTQGSFTIKLAPTLKKYSNQWEFDPDIEINGPDEGSANSCNAPPFTGCKSVFPMTSYSHWSDRFNGVADWQPYGGPGGFNDYDSIEVGDGSADSGMSLAASESQLSLWSLGSAPLILGVDLTKAVTNAYGSSAGLTRRDLRLLMNRQVIAVDQDAIDASRIADVGRPGRSPGYQVFAKVDHRGDGIVGLFNTTTTLSSKPVTITTTAAAIGLPADPRGYLVEDLWGNQSVVGGPRMFRISAAGVISATVPAEGVALYRIIPIGHRHHHN
jgi:hypothetical protein